MTIETRTNELEAQAEALSFAIDQRNIRIAELETHLGETLGAMRAQDERNLAATASVGMAPSGCDTPEVLADEVQLLRARCIERNARAEERLDGMRRLEAHLLDAGRRMDVLADAAEHAAKANHQTPLTMGEAAILELDGGLWIVPKGLYAQVRALKVEEQRLREALSCCPGGVLYLEPHGGGAQTKGGGGP